MYVFLLGYKTVAKASDCLEDLRHRTPTYMYCYYNLFMSIITITIVFLIVISKSINEIKPDTASLIECLPSVLCDYIDLLRLYG